MDKRTRDRKRKQSAIERVRIAVQSFEREMSRNNALTYYEPDLDDLEALARMFENLTKSMRRINDRALAAKKSTWEVDADGEMWVRVDAENCH